MAVIDQAPICTATENRSPPNAQNLETIEAAIKSYQEVSNETYLEIGRLLVEAKEIIGKYGEWLDWLKNNVDISICKAQRLMRVAKWTDGNAAPVPHLDFTKAYILNRLTGNDLKRFLQNWHHVGGRCAKQVETMSKRELEIAVRNHLKSKTRKSFAVQVPQTTANHASTKNDMLNRFDRVRHDVSELASLVENSPDEYDTFAAGLCELCQSIVQQLST